MKQIRKHFKHIIFFERVEYQSLVCFCIKLLQMSTILFADFMTQKGKDLDGFDPEDIIEDLNVNVPDYYTNLV